MRCIILTTAFSIFSFSNMAKQVRTLEERVRILQEVESHPFEKRIRTAARLNLPPSTLRSIILKKDDILKQARQCGFSGKRRKTCRQSVYKDLEILLYSWYCETRDLLIPIDGTMLRQKALEIAALKGIDNFSASNGWVSRFKERHGLVHFRKPSKDPSNPDYVPSKTKTSNSKRKASTKTLKTPATGENSSEKDDKSQVWPSLLNLHPISSEASTSCGSTAPKPQQSTTNPTAAKPETLSTKADDSGASKPNASGGAQKEDPDKLCIVKMEIEDDGYADNEEESFLASLTSSSSQRSQDSTPADSSDCYPSSMRTETNQEIVPTLPKIVHAMNESAELLLNGVEHPVEVFFKDIAQTVMQFPPHLIDETKTKVSLLVYDMVVRSISEGFTNIKQKAL